MISGEDLKSPKLAKWALQVGVAFVLAYAGLESFLHPAEWVGYLPHFMASMSAAPTLIKLVGVYELALAAGLLALGKYLRYAAALAVLTLAGITVFNLPQFFITFRDVGLVFMALALFFTA